MRFLIYYIGCFIVFFHISHASVSQSSLPPLPTLDIPGGPTPELPANQGTTKQRDIQNPKDHLNDEKNISDAIPQVPPQDQIQNQDNINQVPRPITDQPIQSSPDLGENSPSDIDTKTTQDNSQDSFLDTGGYVLPKISSPNSSDRNLVIPKSSDLDEDNNNSDTNLENATTNSESSDNAPSSNSESNNIPSSPVVPLSEKPDTTDDLQNNNSDKTVAHDNLPPTKEEINMPIIPSNNAIPAQSNNDSSVDSSANSNALNERIEGGDIQNKEKITNESSLPGSDGVTTSGDKLKVSNVPEPSDPIAQSSTNSDVVSASNPYVSSSNPPVRTRRGGIDALSMSEDQKRQQELELFLANESIMLLVDDDDIVLGRLTKKAYLEQMPCKEYINLSEKTYVSHMDQKNRNRMESFIRKYDFLHEGKNFGGLSNKEAQDLAFDAIYFSNIDDVRVLINNYPILNNTNEDQSNMLMLAVELGDVPMSKFLIRRGSDIYKTNYDGDNPISLAKKSRDYEIQKIINDAILFGRVR